MADEDVFTVRNIAQDYKTKWLRVTMFIAHLVCCAFAAIRPNKKHINMKTTKKTSNAVAAFKHARALAMTAALAAPMSGNAATQLVNFDAATHAGGATGAAILGTAGDYWTEYTLANGTALTLFTSVPGYNDSGYDLIAAGWGGTYGGTSYGVAGFAPLTGDYFYDTDGSATITVTGLTIGDAYDWVLYTNQGGVNRPLSITVGGTTLTTNGAVDKTVLLEGVNYLRFTGTVTDSNLVASFAFAPGNAGEMDFNGFQLQTTAVPEPSSLAVLMGGIGTLLLVRRRARN
jgi:hypothetical protein